MNRQDDDEYDTLLLELLDTSTRAVVSIQARAAYVHIPKGVELSEWVFNEHHLSIVDLGNYPLPRQHIIIALLDRLYPQKFEKR